MKALFAKILHKIAAFCSAASLPVPDRHASAETYLAAGLGDHHTCVFGARGSGKTTLMRTLAKQQRDCTVLIRLCGEPIPGWAEVPFFGEFAPADGSPSYGLELEDLLVHRPLGVLEICLPADGGDLAVLAAKTALDSLLRAIFGYAGSRSLNLMVDDADRLLAHDMVCQLLRQARYARCALVLSQESFLITETSDFDNCVHVIALRQHHLFAGVSLATRMGVDIKKLSSLPAGHFWYRNCRARAPVKLRFSAFC